MAQSRVTFGEGSFNIDQIYDSDEDESEEFDPIPYSFKLKDAFGNPLNLPSEQMQNANVICPAFHTLLDHLVAVLWILFSQNGLDKLCTSHIHWALKFLEGTKNREGAYSLDIEVAMKYLQQALIDLSATFNEDEIEAYYKKFNTSQKALSIEDDDDVKFRTYTVAPASSKHDDDDKFRTYTVEPASSTRDDDAKFRTYTVAPASSTHDDNADGGEKLPIIKDNFTRKKKKNEGDDDIKFRTLRAAPPSSTYDDDDAKFRTLRAAPSSSTHDDDDNRFRTLRAAPPSSTYDDDDKFRTLRAAPPSSTYDDDDIRFQTLRAAPPSSTHDDDDKFRTYTVAPASSTHDDDDKFRTYTVAPASSTHDNADGGEKLPTIKDNFTRGAKQDEEGDGNKSRTMRSEKKLPSILLESMMGNRGADVVEDLLSTINTDDDIEELTSDSKNREEQEKKRADDEKKAQNEARSIINDDLIKWRNEQIQKAIRQLERIQNIDEIFMQLRWQANPETMERLKNMIDESDK